MFAQFKNLPELFEYFPDQKACLEYWEQIHWQGNPTCPHCGADKPYKTSRGYKCTERTCQKKFTALVNTVFESTKLPLQKWFAAMYLATSCRKGISALQLSRLLSISHKHAWHMLHRIRTAFEEVAPDEMEFIVEADEALVGGKNKNRHIDKKFRNSQGRSSIDKMPVVGLLERGKDVRTFVTDDLSTETLQRIIYSNVTTGSLLITDDYKGYRPLAIDYRHVAVKHTGAGFVQEIDGIKCHTQHIEGFWTLVKKTYHGTYHYISPKHLQAYCNECSFRYNTRKIPDPVRFETAVHRCIGKKLPYRILIADKPGRPRFLKANQN